MQAKHYVQEHHSDALWTQKKQLWKGHWEQAYQGGWFSQELLCLWDLRG